MISPEELRDLELTRHEVSRKQNELISLLNQAAFIGDGQQRDTSEIQNILANIFTEVTFALQRIDELIEGLSYEPESTEEK